MHLYQTFKYATKILGHGPRKFHNTCHSNMENVTNFIKSSLSLKKKILFETPAAQPY